MAVRFRKIDESRVDGTRITLRVMKTDSGIIGRVSTLAIGESGAVELMSTAIEDPPIEVAIRLARDLAKFKESDVDVIDPDDLWNPAWGRLKK